MAALAAVLSSSPNVLHEVNLSDSDFVSKSKVAVNWETNWRTHCTCSLDEIKYERHLAERLPVSQRQLKTKTLNFIISFSYGFPVEDPFLKMLSLNRWHEALSALCISSG